MTPASASAAKLRSKGNSCCTYFKEGEGGGENIFSPRLLHNTSSYLVRSKASRPWRRLTHIIGYVQVLVRHVFIPAPTMQEGGLFNTEAGGGVANKHVAHYGEYNWAKCSISWGRQTSPFALF